MKVKKDTMNLNMCLICDGGLDDLSKRVIPKPTTKGITENLGASEKRRDKLWEKLEPCKKILESMSWIFPFFKYGYQNDLQVKDLYNSASADLSGPLGDELERQWNKEYKQTKKEHSHPSLLRAIRKTFLKKYALYGFLICVQGVGIRMVQPTVLALYIKYFDVTRYMDLGVGWSLAVAIIALSFLNILLMHIASLANQRIGMRCRVACCSLIYRKLLRLNRTALGDTAAGHLINLLSNDVQRFDTASMHLHFIWIMPIQAVLATAILYDSLGPAAFAGIAAITLQAVPLQGYLSRLLGKLRSQIAQKTDNRVKLMNEITSGIQVIKMYAWEKPFEKLVEVARKFEIKIITKTSYIRGFSTALMVFTERTILYLTVITFVLMGNQLTSDVVFSAAQLFNSVQMYMTILYPIGMAGYAEAKISVKRIQEFLMQEEIEVKRPDKSALSEDNGAVKLFQVHASWLLNPIVDTLIGINLDIKPGTLCCIVGPVGAGKSSILQLLCGELPHNSGKLRIQGDISFASQEPWLFVSSVRNNILFGQTYYKTKYHDVIKVCALETDFQQLPYGDKTMVGERGASLSGGQRARVNLARAVYREADIYLFDDPLSAVDAHVGKHLFEKCIVEYLSEKTRFLVTHQLQFLKQADIIVIVNNGKIEKVCPYDELTQDDLTHLNQETQPNEETEKAPEKIRERLMSVTSYASTIEEEENEPQETQELMEKGAIPTSTYVDYYRSGASIAVLLFLLFLLIIAQMSCNAGDLWVTYWTNMEEIRNNQSQYLIDKLINFTNINTIITDSMSSNVNETALPREKLVAESTTTQTPGNVSNATENLQTIDNSTISNFTYIEIWPQNTFIYVYTSFIILSIILTTLRSLLFFKICMNASRSLHNQMFSNILQAPMRFFDTNPSGRILNRFSKDMGAIDELLPRAYIEAIQIFLVMAGILTMVFIVNPWMIIPAIGLGFAFYYCRVIYLSTAQDVKRLEGITRAPVFSHVTATLYGLPTIRSSNGQSMVIHEFDNLQDQHTSAWFLYIASSEAFGFYLDLISVIFLTIVTFQFIILDDGTTLSGYVGLVISQSMILTGMLQYGVRQTAEVASNMTSVERVLQYTKLEKEGPFETLPGNKPKRDWPETGKVLFRNTYLKYTAEDPPVLKNLNVIINSGEKVGIVGRTGAGKSSLISALFRLAPIEGSVEVDDVDTKSVGLNELRSNLSIIPQEPVLFSATVRYNLDPFNKCKDETLWQALESVELRDSIENLQQRVSEGGSNFSAGQRQLMCLARAIVRNNKILIMDEATANVDPNTDSLIQNTIRKNFKDCTVLTIAHRLNTIMDSDKVLVMDAGQSVEFGHPYELLQNPDGYFSQMVHQTGNGMEKKLKQIAKEAYNNLHHGKAETKQD